MRMREAYFQSAAGHNPGGRGIPPNMPRPYTNTSNSTQAIESIIQQAVVRLMEILVHETDALRNRQPIDQREFNSRKAHGLLELDRAVQMLNGAKPDEVTLGLLAKLRDALEQNAQVLALHIEAVREIAGVISDTIREADSDGTYTHSYRSKG
jgi:hypothetical protein